MKHTIVEVNWAALARHQSSAQRPCARRSEVPKRLGSVLGAYRTAWPVPWDYCSLAKTKGTKHHYGAPATCGVAACFLPICSRTPQNRLHAAASTGSKHLLRSPKPDSATDPGAHRTASVVLRSCALLRLWVSHRHRRRTHRDGRDSHRKSMLDERHHTYRLISSVSTIYARVAAHTWSSFHDIYYLSSRTNFQPSPQFQEMTAWNSQATAICARLAFFGGDSEGVGSSMMTLGSHGTKDGDVAVDLDHRDVV